MSFIRAIMASAFWAIPALGLAQTDPWIQYVRAGMREVMPPSADCQKGDFGNGRCLYETPALTFKIYHDIDYVDIFLGATSDPDAIRELLNTNVPKFVSKFGFQSSEVIPCFKDKKASNPRYVMTCKTARPYDGKYSFGVDIRITPNNAF